MGGVGAPIGAMSHYWYIFLDRTLPGITAGAVAKKVLADMCIFGPVCLFTFFAGKLANYEIKLLYLAFVRYGTYGREEQ